MKQLIIRISIIITCLCPVILSAQWIKDVRINEIQVRNSDGFRDEYGQAVAWIELFNNGYNKVNVADCYLRVQGKLYRIPRNDPHTVIPTQGYLVFIAAGDSEKGTFHTNFTLDSTDFVEFLNREGELIDRMDFDPKQMKDKVSFGWIQGEDKEEKLANLPATTPGASNNTVELVSRAEIFHQSDPHGLTMTVTAVVAVAIALILLSTIFTIMGRVIVKMTKKKEQRATYLANKNLVESNSQDDTLTAEEVAAIAMAIHQYLGSRHDVESSVLTINQAEQNSSWNLKSFGFLKKPMRK